MCCDPELQMHLSTNFVAVICAEIDVHQQVQITEVELQPPWTLRQRVLPVHAEMLILRVLPLPLSTHTKASHCEYGV